MQISANHRLSIKIQSVFFGAGLVNPSATFIADGMITNFTYYISMA
ncbi:hypothetical protein PENDEC_c056G05381 [Penicillium decumbens]|uniref:Uncharacterized protein n=1 Tax=Penicillium decumbens TaxID=69771 RepID=A0A1V6NNH1_PENDC|nr:hypothetical protein PENDEC_c056G05381 [Penicillium decumbens]